MAKAAKSLSIFADEDSESDKKPDRPNAPSGKGPRTGSFEKLNMLFGGKVITRKG